MFKSVRVNRRARPKTAIVFAFADRRVASRPPKPFSPRALAEMMNRPEFTEEVGAIAEKVLPIGRLIVVGLGERKAFSPATFRTAVAAVGRRLRTLAAGAIALTPPDGLDPSESGRAAGESLGLLSWDPKLYKGSATTGRAPYDLTLTSSNEKFLDGLEFGLTMASSANLARSLGQTPPNIATPMWMAEQAKQLCEETNMTYRVISGEELAAESLVGLANVGRASANPPCLIRVEYRPPAPKAQKKPQKPVVLIGKTVTYDTGGLSLKVNNGMVGMKGDKDGGCAVLGAMRAVAELIQPPFPVVALLAAAENSVSSDSFRPDDVLTFRNGVTVEVTNTDAEGRLVLADALCWACDAENPACIIDLATLTGGVVTALGSTYAGYWCEDDSLRKDLEEASQATGERIWRLPMHSEYRDMMRSPVADLINSNPNRHAHPIQGTAFLSYFVKTGIPWAHIDIAGVHKTTVDKGPYVPGPTGFGVRLLAEMLRRRSRGTK